MAKFLDDLEIKNSLLYDQTLKELEKLRNRVYHKGDIMIRLKDDLGKYIEKALKKNPSLKNRLGKADQAWDIAFQIISIREKAGLTQKDLAILVGTKQSNIARLESADYTGYTIKTIEKVAKALQSKLEIRIIPETNRNAVHA